MAVTTDLAHRRRRVGLRVGRTPMDDTPLTEANVITTMKPTPHKGAAP